MKMSSAMPHLAAACLWACAISASAPAQDQVPDGQGAPARVLSAGICADPFVIALADRDAIAALSWQSGQPISAAPDWARALPHAWPEAERLLILDPDLAVFGPGGPGRAGPILQRAGIRSLTLDWGEDFDTVRANARRVGAAVGNPDGAAALIADLDARLAALAARAEARGQRPSIFYFNVSGGTAGSGTLIDAVIAAAGGRNAAAEAGASGWTPANPEWVLRVAPDLIVTSYFRDGYPSISTTGARHSLFRDLLSRTPRVDVPSAHISCAGPSLIDAAEAIAEALDEIAGSGA